MKKYHSFFTGASARQNADVLFIDQPTEKRASGIGPSSANARQLLLFSPEGAWTRTSGWTVVTFPRLFNRPARHLPRRHPTSTERVIMTSSIYSASVPVFKQMLTALSGVLKKAEAHATEKNIEPNALLQARLFPDMFPLVRQVQIAADFSKGVSSRLAGVEVPSWPDTEVTFADLQALIAKALAHLGTLDAAQFEGSENKEIVLRPGTPKEKKLVGSAYLQNYGLPQFFFHVTTAYAILRHNGVEIGKRDYMGSY
jgi:uncharacterized protein